MLATAEPVQLFPLWLSSSDPELPRGELDVPWTVEVAPSPRSQPQAQMTGERSQGMCGGGRNWGTRCQLRPSPTPHAGPAQEPWQPPQEAEPCTQMSVPSCPQLGLHAEPSLGALDVTIMYKGRTVLQEVVGRPSCVLLYGAPGLAIEATEPQLVAFPSPAELPDQKQLHYTEKLLQHVDPGLQLELRELRLWARRQGKCKVYWEVGGPLGCDSPSTPARLLQRNCCTLIFDFRTFFRGQWCPWCNTLPLPAPPRTAPPPLTRAPSCRVDGIPGSPAPGLPTLHHLPGLWAGPVSRETQGEEPSPGEGEGRVPHRGGDYCCILPGLA